MDTVPVELLEKILSNLKGTEVFACRRVCSHWRNVIDSFTDAMWSQYCDSDFLSPHQAKRVSNLNYQELYKSLSLWDKVEEAKVTVKNVFSYQNKQIPDFVIKFFNDSEFTIVNFTISPDYCPPCSDTIQYFSSITLEKLSDKKFSFLFSSYDESDKIIAMTEPIRTQNLFDNILNFRLHIMLKNNPDMAEVCYDLFKKGDGLYEIGKNFSLISDSEVCFINKSKIVCIARLKVFYEKEIIETVQLARLTFRDSNERVIQFVRTGHNAVNILTEQHYRQQCNIYSSQDQNFIHQCEINLNDVTPFEVKILNKYGFQLTDQDIFHFVFPLGHKVQTHNNHVVFIETIDDRRSDKDTPYTSILHIFKRPYDDNNIDIDVLIKTIYLVHSEPNKTMEFGPNSIIQIDVVEILGGHRLFVSTTLRFSLTRKLFIIDLEHNQSKDDDEPQPNASSKKARIGLKLQNKECVVKLD